MTNHPRTTEETVLVRERAYDDVRIKRRVRAYWPDFAPKRTKVSARQALGGSVMSLLMLASLGLGYGTVGLSGAFLSDAELSSGNVLAAQIHDFAAGVAPVGLKVVPAGSSILVPLSISPTPGSPDLHYRITASYVAGDQSLCNALVASTSHPFAYNSSLLGLNGVSFVTPSTFIEVSLPAPVPNLPPDAPCTFDIVVRSWNALVPESTGYFDEERMQVTIIDPPADAAPPTDPVPEPEPEPLTEPEPEPEPIPEPIVEEPTPVEPAPEPTPEIPAEEIPAE